ncbi:Hsp70 family protein [Dactylosporangium sp. NPDC000244]|uniref:Hsp70 family protein n=1 Tax=Dactylosporangium sp. NPDC000244 TaxID=3154365 RepID=UPI00331E0941
MTAARLRLGVDFGTSTTIAMLQRADARVQPLLFDGSPLLSSAVLLGPDGQLHTGRDAAHLARSAPERLEPNPKRRIDDTAVLLGDREVGVRDLIVAVLGRVAREATRVAGPVRDVALTHPASWGQNRRSMLVDAARHAGFLNIELVGEPTAAATYFAHTRGGAFPPGACVLVYDLGAGTCDVTLLRRTQTGFEQVASDGLNDVGGLDVDAAIIAFLQATYGELWRDPAQRRQLWDDVRSAKEMLSRASGTVIGVPALGREVPLGREQLEGLTRPVLRSTISMTRALVNESGVGTAAIAGLFLVGGSSRIPLVATMLHETLGVAPVVAEQPELVVAEGSLYVNRMPNSAPATASVAAPVSAVPSSGMPYQQQTGAFAAGQVSAPAFAAAPVSPAVQGYPQPPVMPQQPVPMPPRMNPPARRGLSPAALVAIVLAAVLLVGGGIAGATYLTKDTPGGNSQAGAGATTGAAKAAGGPGRYNLDNVPEDECQASDASMFNDLFEAEISKPTPSRNPNATINSSTCGYTRAHALTDSKQQRTASISFTVFAANDVSLAQNMQSQEASTARLAGPNSEVPNLGEEAIFYETPGTGDQVSRLTMTLGVRDSNVRLQVYFIGSRGDGAAWTQKEKNDVRDRVISAARATFTKSVAGMKK